MSTAVAHVNPPIPPPQASRKLPKDYSEDIQAVNVLIAKQDNSLGFELSEAFPPHVVVNVKPGGHAARNGLCDGDVLAFIGGVDVQHFNQEQLLDYLASSTENDPVHALVFRNGLKIHCIICDQFLLHLLSYFSSSEGD